jgi:hypothetical protein
MMAEPLNLPLPPYACRLDDGGAPHDAVEFMSQWELSFPKIPSDPDSHRKTESSHH